MNQRKNSAKDNQVFGAVFSMMKGRSETNDIR